MALGEKFLSSVMLGTLRLSRIFSVDKPVPSCGHTQDCILSLNLVKLGWVLIASHLLTFPRVLLNALVCPAELTGFLHVPVAVTKAYFHHLQGMPWYMANAAYEHRSKKFFENVLPTKFS